MTTILFTGGGTLGPVAPLLAVLKRLRDADPSYRFCWAGTDSGPERDLVEAERVPFVVIPVAKLPRYVSRQLLTLPVDLLRARRESRRLLEEYHPRLVLSAGGFTAVPVVQEAYKRRIPCISHQLDYEPGLSNLMIAKRSRYVTTSFSYLRCPFPAGVTCYAVPTPVRFRHSELPTREAACRSFGFDPLKPVILVTGGGTGAVSLNDAVFHIRKRFPPSYQILHLTGKGKSAHIISDEPGYIVLPFLADQMLAAYAASDVVVSRAGMGAISELAALQRSAILVPLPDSPQEANAKALKDAVIVVDQKRDGWMEQLKEGVQRLMDDGALRQTMGMKLFDTLPTDDGSALANLALSVLV